MKFIRLLAVCVVVSFAGSSSVLMLSAMAQDTDSGVEVLNESVNDTVGSGLSEAADASDGMFDTAIDEADAEQPKMAEDNSEQEKGIDAFIAQKVGPISQKALGIVFYTVKLVFKDRGGFDFAFLPSSKKEIDFVEGQKIEVPLILLWLVVAAIYLTFYLRFVNLRGFCRAIGILRGKYEAEQNEAGQISRFQALSTSLSGTVGLGNIAGVAVAVSVGGPGAVFWMFTYAFFCMSSKFAECALAVKYRHEREDGVYSGGPMHYLHDGLAQIRFGGGSLQKVGLILGGIFAICCIGGSLGGGNLFQANQAYAQLVNVTGGEESFWFDKGWLFGSILAVLVGAVIIGGIKSIGNVAGKIVPLMAGIYLLAGGVVLIANAAEIPSAIGKIVSMAFSVKAGLGGFIGAVITGVQRANFSNESGLGSAAIAHAAARTDNHVSQGLVAMLGPVIDTMIICMMTALVIVVTGVYEGGAGMEGVELTSRAFETTISWFPNVLAVAVLLFAFSTMIAWSYYGVKSATYLFGENKVVEIVFKLFFCACCIVGATADMRAVVDLTDALIFTMAVPNIIGLYLLSRNLQGDVDAYFSFIKNEKQSGQG